VIYQLEVLTQPAPPVTVEQARAHLRVDHGYDDAYIEALVDAARQHAEDAYLWQSTTRREYRLLTDGVALEVTLPMGPVDGVAEVQWMDAEGSYWPVTGGWRLTWAEPGRLQIDELPAEAVRLAVRYTAGPLEAPAWMRQAVLLLVGYWYEQRQAAEVRPGVTAVEVPLAVSSLLLARRGW
jgi:uncharacterized phiE125 gp8 family phage protein